MLKLKMCLKKKRLAIVITFLTRLSWSVNFDNIGDTHTQAREIQEKARDSHKARFELQIVSGVFTVAKSLVNTHFHESARRAP